MTSEQADFIVSYINALEECSNHQRVMERLTNDGYTATEIDSSLKALGEIAGRDCGIF